MISLFALLLLADIPGADCASAVPEVAEGDILAVPAAFEEGNVVVFVMAFSLYFDVVIILDYKTVESELAGPVSSREEGDIVRSVGVPG